MSSILWNKFNLLQRVLTAAGDLPALLRKGLSDMKAWSPSFTKPLGGVRQEREGRICIEKSGS